MIIPILLQTQENAELLKLGIGSNLTKYDITLLHAREEDLRAFFIDNDRKRIIVYFDFGEFACPYSKDLEIQLTNIMELMFE